MDHNRLRQIIEAYGAQPEKWPADEQQSARQLLNTDDAAQMLFSSQRPLDELLDTFQVEVNPHLHTQILAALPARTLLDRCLDWLLPSADQLVEHFWRPVLVASLPLMIGVALGGSLFTTVEAETWAGEEEIQLIALDDTPVDFSYE